MRQKLINIVKRALIIILCVITVSSAVISSIPVARADSSGILGTNAALGSPILNENFTVDNWNKWEIICWGVFLSNFCQPLIDNYESAFKTGAGGSDGAGYKALCFGSGSDNENNKVIQSFCDYAILQQKSGGTKDVYVTYTLLECTPAANTWTIDDSRKDPNLDATAARKAHFSDFFFYSETTGELSDVNTIRTASDMIDVSLGSNSYGFNGTYTNVAHIGKAFVPTFWIKNASGKYVKVLDFMDTWDIQVMSLIINNLRTSENKSDFSTTFESLFEDSTSVDFLSSSSDLVEMDLFGNLMVDDKMLFPAAVNPNITEDKSINLLNSWVFNSYNSTYSTDQLIRGLKAQDSLSIFGITLSPNVGGQPAFNDSKVGNAAFLYYDLDSIMVADYTSSQDVGEAFEKFFKLDISRSDNKYPLEIELAGADNDYINFFNKIDTLAMTSLTASFLVNMPSDIRPVQVQPEMLHTLVATNGDEVELFEANPVLITPFLSYNDKDKSDIASRYFTNYLYKAVKGDVVNTTGGSLAQVKDIFTYSSSVDVYDSIVNNLEGPFKSAYPQYKDVNFVRNPNVTTHQFTRMCLVYPISDVLKTVSSVLGCADGTEFNTYSTMIYMTYLDWYGVANKTTFTSGTEKTSKFNTEIYDDTSPILTDDIDNIYSDFKTDEEKKEEILEMSYLMLHPEDGRAYRKSLIYNGITDFLYEQYNRIVYGGSNSAYSGSASKSNSGFLAVETFAENWLTKWFLDSYVDIAVWLIAISTVLLIIMGLLKSRKLSWYVFGIFTIVNVILLVPSSGELVPLLTSSFVQEMFSNKMTAWSMAEGITNAAIEDDAAKQSGGMSQLTDEEAELAVKLIKQLNVVYIDRSLMLKQDISQKLTQQLGGVYTEIQQLQSARWILPMVMQQFTNDEDVYGSMYVKLSNVWDDATNFYWYYKNSDAAIVTKVTSTSRQFNDANGVTANLAKPAEKENLATFFADYKEPTWSDDADTNINYANYSYTVNSDTTNIVHTYSWILPDNGRMLSTKRATVFGSDYAKYDNADSWQLYTDYIVNSNIFTLGNWETTREDNDLENDNGANAGFEQIADQYDRANASTLMAGYSFYKTTESPFYYFFNVVKDSFHSTNPIGAVIGRLQGEIELDENSKEVRSNFMYATSTSTKEVDDEISGKVTNLDVAYTGYIRDVLDLQFFFNNTVPYLYQMTMMTGGFDGESGILVDKATGEPLKISNESDFYEGINQSWVYRCNWAVKLMENPEYSRPTTVRKSKANGGDIVEIKNPMIPDCYPSDRPMVFSEAQMKAEGLQKEDLNIVELKCIQVNEDVAKQWTLMINYAGAQGLTKEVLFRQMATDATMIFNREFSSNGALNTVYNIYPQSIDLRYLSFDSVMKMLMLNVSKDTSYIYGDTMSTLIETTDTFTASLLLLAAFLCAYVVPLARTILMAMIFYLGFIAILRAIFSSAKYKGKVACGQLVSNILFMAYTLIYYACFCGLMAITSSDEVLSEKTITANAGNPVWVLFAVVLVSLVYIVIMWKQICFCFAHFRDMGFEMYAQVASAVTGKIGDALGGLGDRLSSWASGEEITNNITNTTNTNSMKGTGIMKDKPQDVNIRQTSGSNITVSSNVGDDDEALPEDMYINTYASDDGIENVDTTSASDINAEIEAGKQMDSDS